MRSWDLQGPWSITVCLFFFFFLIQWWKLQAITNKVVFIIKFTYLLTSWIGHFDLNRLNPNLQNWKTNKHKCELGSNLFCQWKVQEQKLYASNNCTDCTHLNNKTNIWINLYFGYKPCFEPLTINHLDILWQNPILRVMIYELITLF